MKIFKTIKFELRCLILAGISLFIGLFFLVSANSVAVRAETNITESYLSTDMYCDGASIRLTNDKEDGTGSGIRFHVRVDSDESRTFKLDVVEDGEVKEVDYTNRIEDLNAGILVIPSRLLGDNELTIEGATTGYENGIYAANSTDGGWVYNHDETSTEHPYFYESKTYVYNIPEDKYEQEFSFRGYYIIGNKIYYTETQERSVSYVALRAKIDDNEKKATDSQSGYKDDWLTTLNGFLPSTLANKHEKFVNDTYLYRVGNANEVDLASLLDVDILEGLNITDLAGKNIFSSETIQGNASCSTPTVETNSNGTLTTKLRFSGTGVVKLSIKNLNDYTRGEQETTTEMLFEVIDAKNITTKAESATSNDVVLLNDISGTFTVSNGYTFHGNGFTVTLPTTSVQNVGNGFTGYISIGAAQDDGNASGGNLDNVRIEGPVYPEMYIYRDQAKITDTSDADYGDGYNMRYFKNSVIVYGGNCTISNCYISGSRTALCLRGGNNVVIENTTLSGGAYANMQICAGSNVTLRNLTTVQVDVTDSYGKGKTAHGLGIAVDSDVVDIYIEGELNQHNWLCEEQWNSIVPSSYQSSFPKFFTDNTFKNYWHYLNGGTAPYVNMSFIFACNWDKSKIHDNRTTVDYGTCDATIALVAGGVYSKVNTVGGKAINDTNLADPGYESVGFNPVAPTFTFDNTANDDDDDYCVYDESSGTLKIGVSGDSKTIDLSGVSVTKNGVPLGHTAYLNGTEISGNFVTIKAADGAKQTLTFKATSNDVGYDKDGTPIEGSIEYTWTVTVEMAVLAYPAPVWNMGGTYKFDTSNCYYAYYQTSQGYGEAVPIYEGIKVNYYDKKGNLVNLDLSGTTTLPTGSANSNSNAFTYTLSDGSTLTMKYSSGWKSGATTHQFTVYSSKAYVYPQSLDNDNYVRAKTTNQNFDVKITYTFTDPNGQSTETVTMNWYNAAASNGSVSTVQWKTFDSTNGKNPTTCVTSDMLVTLADGTQKEIQYVTNEDEFLVWDFVKGEYTVKPAILFINHGYGKHNVVALRFDDGTVVKIVGEHGFFDKDLKQFVMLSKENVSDFIGHNFVKQDVEKTTKLVSYDIYEEYTDIWTVVTAEHNNCFFGGMMTVTPSEVDNSERWLIPFEVGEDMKYDEELMQADIEKYGLFTYEDFDEYLTYEQFIALNIAHYKVAIGKGYITYEEVLYLLGTYFEE